MGFGFALIFVPWTVRNWIQLDAFVVGTTGVGGVMLARLEALKEKYRCVGEVRGRGLMLGMELVKDRRTKEPLGKDVTQALYKECLRRGLAAMTYSPTVRINPPLIIREEAALNGLAILDEALGTIVREHRLQ